MLSTQILTLLADNRARSYRAIAARLEQPKSTVWDCCKEMVKKGTLTQNDKRQFIIPKPKTVCPHCGCSTRYNPHWRHYVCSSVRCGKVTSGAQHP